LEAQLQQPGKGLNQCTSASRRFHHRLLNNKAYNTRLVWRSSNNCCDGWSACVFVVVAACNFVNILLFLSLPPSSFNVLLIADLPLKETVAHYGPFVMNTKEERSIRLWKMIIEAVEWARLSFDAKK
jgi:hypothetical protein